MVRKTKKQGKKLTKELKQTEEQMQVASTVRDTIQRHAIPRSTVSKLSGMWPTDLSAYLNGREDLTPERQQRVAQTVSDIVKVIETMPMKVDLRDPENVRRLIAAVNDAEMQLNLALEGQPPLREIGGTAAD